MAPSEEPILFLWSLSPWASKIVSYLALRGIPHARCEQPITQPRPDLAALGLHYRRIPVLSVGRDIYCDTLLILEKLEELYPPPPSGSAGGYKQISATNPTELALEKLFEKWTDTVVFKPAAACIPTSLDLMKDEGFQKDREELWGRSWDQEAQDKLRPAGLANLRANFEFLEEVLGDGRAWVLGGREEEGPRLADIHACWIFDWLFQISAYDPTFFNPETFPKTFAWRERYSAAISSAKEKAPTPAELEGKDAVSKVLNSGFDESELKVHPDPTGLKAGEEVAMWPVDTGYNCKDEGKLVGLSSWEAVVSSRAREDEGKEVRIHYPRWNFEIAVQN